LEYLSLAYNKFGSEASTALWQYLSKNASSLTHLALSNTMPNLKVILDGVSSGKVPLKKLVVSKNKVTGESDLNGLTSFLSTNTCLEFLDLSSTQLPASTLEKMLTSINTDLNLEVDLSDNLFGLAGAKVLSKIAYKLNNISVLNLANNDFGDEGVADLLTGLRNNFSIKKLTLNGNFKGGKTKHSMNAVDNLVKLINSECAIEVLHITAKHHPLKHELLPFVASLGNNNTLTEVAISGHQMGNKGAVALARVLQTNHCLTSLSWDGNLTGLMGFSNIKYALKLNKTLKYMPLPVSDIGELLKSGGSNTDVMKLKTTITKIEQLILNNQVMN